MADLARTGPVGPLFDVVCCCVPVVGERVVPHLLPYFEQQLPGVPQELGDPQQPLEGSGMVKD